MSGLGQVSVLFQEAPSLEGQCPVQPAQGLPIKLPRLLLGWGPVALAVLAVSAVLAALVVSVALECLQVLRCPR